MNDFHPETKVSSYKSVMVEKTLQKRLVNLYHFEFYSLFMYFKSVDAVGLFFFHFLTDGIQSAKMILFDRSLNSEEKEIEEEIKSLKKALKTLEEENPESTDKIKELSKGFGLIFRGKDLFLWWMCSWYFLLSNV